MIFSRETLAWTPEQGEKQRIKRIVLWVLPIFLVLTVAISWIDLPPPDREKLEKLPPQLAKIIATQKKEPPKPIVKKEEPKPEPEKKPEPKVAEKPKDTPKIEHKPKLSDMAKPEELQAAREKANNSGLLAMKKQFSTLSSLAKSVKLETPLTIATKPITRTVEDKLAKNATSTTRSAGLEGVELSKQTQQLELASRTTAEVEEHKEVTKSIAEEDVAVAKKVADRSTEDIRRTMDANKSSIHSIYNRALRKRPSLRGVITPELVIEETGVVSSCNIVESTLNEPDLEQKICKRLLLVNFGAKNGVDKKTVRYPIELLPG